VTTRAILISRLQALLDKERFAHSLRVEKVAVELARQWGVSVKLASQAALLHDCARGWRGPELLQAARRSGLPIRPLDRFEPKLLHARLSARLAQRRFGLRSAAVLKAIKNHMLGAPVMSRLEQIVYLADHLESGRRYRGVKKIRQLAFKSLDRAILAMATKMLQYLLARDLPIDPGTVATRNYYRLKKI
jgi:predicted HD superfamily hydrolase involved in NAD metabolism